MQRTLSSDEIGELTEVSYGLAGDVGFDRLAAVSMPGSGWNRLA
jgi:hypothetical protein